MGLHEILSQKSKGGLLLPGIPSPTRTFSLLSLLPEQQPAQLSAKTTALVCCFCCPCGLAMGSAGHKYAGDTKLFSSIRYLLAGLIQKSQPHTRHIPRQPPISPGTSPVTPLTSQAHPLRALSISAARQGTSNLFWISRSLTILLTKRLHLLFISCKARAGGLLLLREH